MSNKYISANYIGEKIWPIEQLIKIMKESDSDSIGDKISDSLKEYIALSMASIAKELGVKIPDV